MQSPLSAQPFAQANDASGPSPKRRISSTPPITLAGLASPTPAGPVMGQISTHLPHCVQASTISAVRAFKASSKVASVIYAMVASRRSFHQHGFGKKKAATCRRRRTGTALDS
jgi:hypothetical protein